VRERDGKKERESARERERQSQTESEREREREDERGYMSDAVEEILSRTSHILFEK